jgi:hypothetical protein
MKKNSSRKKPKVPSRVCPPEKKENFLENFLPFVFFPKGLFAFGNP